MTAQHYEEAQLEPLLSDSDIERRVADLVGRANSRQLWLMFLDDYDIQLPLLIPIEGLPSAPDGAHIVNVVESIRFMMVEVDAAALILVFERYAAAELTPQDAAWALAMRTECDNQGVNLRAMLLSHRGGVRWIAPDDYIGAVAGS
ncbi:MAG TPA: hypothetical protein VGI56_07850 [Galbitalea sp.]|jgi:hypothetical protein